MLSVQGMRKFHQKRRSNMIDLGYANGWAEEPQLHKEAREKGYKFEERKVGNCVYEYVCKELDFKFRVDSSD